MSWPLLLFLGFLSLTDNALCEKNKAFTYDFESENHVSIRSKRQSKNSEELSEPDLSQNDSSVFWWRKNESQWANYEEVPIDHTYYEMLIMNPSEESFNEHYLDILAMLKMPNVQGNQSHPLLGDSYRRAVSTKISFEFPFYGHTMQNLTIATGGFCYIGDHAHSWLAATQYIAPLMANFDTHLPKSTVMYADNGTVFVIEWSRVQLRDDPKAGNFTFQVSLHKNGDIWFVYKEVPIAVEEIGDTFHPRKLGISDAYLINHPITSPSPEQAGLSKRVIYEYHRIEVDADKVKSKTVVILKALPTCISLTTCHSCANSTIKNFNCSWCQVGEKNGGSFCSDEAGLHRRRQDWASGSCKEQSRNLYCNDEEQEKKDKQSEKGKTSSPREPESSPDSPQVVPLDSEGRLIDRENERGRTSSSTATGSGGAIAVLLVLATVVALVGWLTYAYHNPHTSSGQLLIRYRPARWRWPNSDARCAYTASVHM
uniref:Plexin domain-containing protein 2 n=1 Tax=Plectus sambesii TaxID=2011161 RepID=A0A914XP74_9BILA